ncbi:uncharacterized protein LOC131954128 [Physella acuta]|uniref:uncharacterized protein LOC131954128 n=1 Tax=Physella acuta TaxID=109671 RepID=UPI0027DD8DE7|nr:uncharacterized protein LOC131954128 [Physella acuta]
MLEAQVMCKILLHCLVVAMVTAADRSAKRSSDPVADTCSPLCQDETTAELQCAEEYGCFDAKVQENSDLFLDCWSPCWGLASKCFKLCTESFNDILQQCFGMCTPTDESEPCVSSCFELMFLELKEGTLHPDHNTTQRNESEIIQSEINQSDTTLDSIQEATTTLSNPPAEDVGNLTTTQESVKAIPSVLRQPEMTKTLRSDKSHSIQVLFDVMVSALDLDKNSSPQSNDTTVSTHNTTDETSNSQQEYPSSDVPREEYQTEADGEPSSASRQRAYHQSHAGLLELFQPRSQHLSNQLKLKLDPKTNDDNTDDSRRIIRGNNDTGSTEVIGDANEKRMLNISLPDPGFYHRGDTAAYDRYKNEVLRQINLYFMKTQHFFDALPTDKSFQNKLSLLSRATGSYDVSSIFIQSSRSPDNNPVLIG